MSPATPKKLLLQRTAFVAIVAASIALQGLYLFNLLRWPAAPDRGFWMHFDLGVHVVGQTRPLGEEAGLASGDRILAVNGREYRTYREYLEILSFDPGEQNVYEIQRGAQTLSIPVPVRPLGLEIVLLHNLPTLLLGSVFIAMGILVFLMKPYHGPGWAFFGMASLGGILVTYTRAPFLYQPAWLTEVFRVSAFLFGAAMIHLAFVFPKPRAAADHWRWIAALYLVAAGLAAHSVAQGDWRDVHEVGTWVRNLLFFVPLAGLLVFVGSAGEIFLRTRSNAARLQSLVIMTGTLFAFVVPLTEIIFTTLFGTKFFPDLMYSWLPFVAAFPVSIGYAIVRHDLFEIDVFVRRTYGYLLSSGVVVLLYGITISTLNLLVGPSEIARSPFFTVAFVLTIVFLMQPLQGRIQAFVDRAFYRLQYDYRKTITAITDRMTTLLEPGLVRETILNSAVDEMFLENGLLLTPEEGDGRFAVALSAGDAPSGASGAVQLDPALVEALADQKVTVFRHEIELAPQYEAVRTEMQASFDSLEAELMMPMLYQREMRAVLSLGRKKSGRMFSREDVDLLRTLVGQGAVALENARLFDDLADSLKQVQMLETVKTNLAKFVPQTVQDLIEDSPEGADPFQKEERDLTVMFADMTGYTRLSSQLPLEELNAIIERYFGAFLDEILRNGGDVNETAGDGLMVLFQGEDPTAHARAAARTALGIQRLTRQINSERSAESFEATPVGMHIGLNSGVASVGATKIQGGVGSRWTYTASGPITNVAARIGALGEEIAITGATRERLGSEFTVEEVGLQALKNVKEPVAVYRLTAVTGNAPQGA
jgi:class 3 adenylate cyclase